MPTKKYNQRVGETLDAKAVILDCELRLGALGRTSGDSVAGFAATCAQRILSRPLEDSDKTHSPFMTSCEALLRDIWRGIEKSDPSTRLKVQTGLRALGIDVHRPRYQSLEEEADDDAAAAIIFAAQVFCTGEIAPALWAARRMLDHADREARSTWLDTSPHLSDGAADPMQAELSRIRRVLHILEAGEWAPSKVKKLMGEADD